MIQASLILQEAAGSASMPIGIHNKVTFTGMTVEKGWLDITFANKERQSMRKRLFAPSGTMMFEVGTEGNKRTETPEEALQRERSRNLVMVGNVLEAVLPEEEFKVFGGKDYDEFIKKAEVSLNKYKGALVNLKVIGKVITNKETRKKSTVPDIQNYMGFVQKWVEGEEPTLSFSKKELEVMNPPKETDASPFE